MTRVLGLCIIGIAVVGATAQPRPHRDPMRTTSTPWWTRQAAQLRRNDAGARTMIEHVVARPRGNTEGPFNVQFRSPEMGDLGQQFGASTRFVTTVLQRLYELAIIITARHGMSQFEWLSHDRSALQAGISPAVAGRDAERRGNGPYFATELLETKQVSGRRFEAANGVLDQPGVVELINVMGMVRHRGRDPIWWTN